MKKFVSLLVISAIIIFGSVGQAVAQKKKAKAPTEDVEVVANIAIVDTILIRRNAKAFKSIRSQIEKFRGELRKQARSEDAALQKVNRELARQRAILTPEAFREERKKFETRIGNMQKKFQSRWRTLKEAERDAEVEVLKVLKKLTVELAQKKQLIMVLRKQSLVFWADTLEVTDDIIKILDKKLPKVKVVLKKKSAPLSKDKGKTSKK